MKTLTLAAGFLFAVLSGAAPADTTFPGGVAAPIFWSARDTADRIDLPPGGALTVFAVFLPADHEQVVWSIVADDSSRQVLTDRRLVDLQDYRYLNFPTTVTCAGPVLRTYERSGGDAGAESNANQLLPAAHPNHPELPIAPRGEGLLELLIYDRVLRPRERQRVETDLAIRYGLTLDQEEATHYLDAGGHPIWDGHRNRAYRHRVFGLHLPAAAPETVARSRACGGELIFVSAEGGASPFSVLISDDDGPTILTDRRLDRSWVMESHGSSPPPLRLHLRPRHLYETLAPDNAWDLLVDTSGTGRFEQPLRISIREGHYALPAVRERQHFTFAPARPVVHVDPGTGFDHLSLGPNPSPDGRYRLRVVLRDAEELRVDVFTTLGQRVTTLTSARARYHELSDALPTAGAYLLRLRAGETATTTQLTVQ